MHMQRSEIRDMVLKVPRPLQQTLSPSRITKGSPGMSLRGRGCIVASLDKPDLPGLVIDVRKSARARARVQGLGPDEATGIYHSLFHTCALCA